MGWAGGGGRGVGGGGELELSWRDLFKGFPGGICSMKILYAVRTPLPHWKSVR